MPLRISESVPLEEAAPSHLGSRKFRARLIESDIWGSSGYYSAAVLKEAATAKVFGASTPIFFDHPGYSESSDRPERSVRDLAGKITSDAVLEADGLYADIEIYPHVAAVVEAMAADIGMSIRATAEVDRGEAAGRNGVLISRFVEAQSVDLVTKAGAGGKIISLMESARAAEATADDRRDQLQRAIPSKSYIRDYDPDEKLVFYVTYDPATDKQQLWSDTYTPSADDKFVTLTGEPTEVRQVTTYVPVSSAGPTTTTESLKEMKMPQIEEAKLAKLNEAAGRVTTLEAERDTEKARADQAVQALAESNAAGAAEKRARASLADAELPPAAIDRIVTTACTALPMKEGALDEAAFDTRVTEAKTAEATYIASITPQGVLGFGASSTVSESTTKAGTNPWGRNLTKEA